MFTLWQGCQIGRFQGHDSGAWFCLVVGTGDPVAIYTNTREFSKITIAADGQTFRGTAVPGAPGAFYDLVGIFRTVITWLRCIGLRRSGPGLTYCKFETGNFFPGIRNYIIISHCNRHGIFSGRSTILCLIAYLYALSNCFTVVAGIISRFHLKQIVCIITCSIRNMIGYALNCHRVITQIPSCIKGEWTGCIIGKQAFIFYKLCAQIQVYSFCI